MATWRRILGSIAEIEVLAMVSLRENLLPIQTIHLATTLHSLSLSDGV